MTNRPPAPDAPVSRGEFDQVSANLRDIQEELKRIRDLLDTPKGDDGGGVGNGGNSDGGGSAGSDGSI
jgi:hypothetical protein